MKKIVIEKSGSYDQLQLKQFTDPHPQKGEVLIKTAACGVNFADCCVRMGVYSSAKKFVGWPITPGFEVSGTIAEVGEGVTHFSKDDRVLAITLFGGYSTHIIASQENVFPIPEGIDLVQAAAIPAVFLTAYYALFELVHPKENQLLLIHSAAGGVGSSLVQLGKLAGCQVVGVVGSARKINFVRQLGALAVIDKSSSDLWKEAKRWAPQGYDAIFDANGVETLKSSYRHLNAGGKLVVYGFHTMFSKGKGAPNWAKMLWDYLRTPKFNPMNMTSDNHSILAFNLSYLFEQKEMLRRSLEKIILWFQEKKLILPPIKTYPLEQAKQAHRDLETGETMGKLILIC